MMTSRPCCWVGTNGSGGAGMTLAIVDSSSGPACASATKAAITSGVGGPDDDRRPQLLEAAVEHAAGLVVRGLAGRDDPTVDGGGEPPPDRDHGGIRSQQRH